MQKTLSNKKIQEILAEHSSEKQDLIKALHQLQEYHPQKYLCDEALNACCSHFKLTKAEVYGVVTYYSMFSTTPRGKYHISLCKSPVCTSMGSANLVKHLEDNYKLKSGSITDDKMFSLEKVECLGRCGKAPSMMINKDVYTNLTPEKVDQILNSLKNEK